MHGPFPPSYCPLPFSALTHSLAQAQPSDLSLCGLPGLVVSFPEGRGSGQGLGLSPTMPQPSQALVPCPRPSSGETWSRTGKPPHLQSHHSWGHPHELCWSSQQLLPDCPLSAGDSPALTTPGGHQPQHWEGSWRLLWARHGPFSFWVVESLWGEESLQSLGSQDSRSSGQWVFATRDRLVRLH